MKLSRAAAKSPLIRANTPPALFAAASIVAQWDRVATDGQTQSWGGTIVLHYPAVGLRAILLIVAVMGTVTAWPMLVDLTRRTAEGIPRSFESKVRAGWPATTWKNVATHFVI